MLTLPPAMGTSLRSNIVLSPAGAILLYLDRTDSRPMSSYASSCARAIVAIAVTRPGYSRISQSGCATEARMNGQMNSQRAYFRSRGGHLVEVEHVLACPLRHHLADMHKLGVGRVDAVPSSPPGC